MATKLTRVVLDGDYRGQPARAVWERQADGGWRVLVAVGKRRTEEREPYRKFGTAKPCWAVSLCYFAKAYREPNTARKTKAKRAAVRKREPVAELPAGAVVKFSR